MLFQLTGDFAGPPAVSPDGRSIVFAAVDPLGKRQLWIRRLDSLTPEPLPSTEDGDVSVLVAGQPLGRVLRVGPVEAARSRRRLGARALRRARRPRRSVGTEGHDPVLAGRARRAAAGVGQRRQRRRRSPRSRARRTPATAGRRFFPTAATSSTSPCSRKRAAIRARCSSARSAARSRSCCFETSSQALSRERPPAVPARPDAVGAAVRRRQRDAERRAGGGRPRRDAGPDDLARHLRRQRVGRARLSERPARHAADDVRPAGPPGRDHRRARDHVRRQHLARRHAAWRSIGESRPTSGSTSSAAAPACA